MNIKQPLWKKITIASSIVGSVLSIGIIYHLWLPRGPIFEFDPARDTQPILNIFERDWYWLLSSEDYSPEFMLKHHAPNRNPLYMGRLRIKVMRQHDTFAGFVAYYMKTSNVGFILFLAVEPKFRGKKYGAQLSQYALNDLIRIGAKRIMLVTRTSNLPAQRVYNELGFIETSRDDEGYVYFEYIP